MNVPQPDMPRMQMWFDFASPYSYLAIERIEDLAREAGVRVELRPFLLGPIFQAQGWNDTPFRLFPGKGAYMMRDIARLADKYGVIYRRPRLFPRMSVLPARIALMGQDESWGAISAWPCSAPISSTTWTSRPRMWSMTCCATWRWTRTR